MPLDARIHYKTFARVDRQPNVSSRFWSRLFENHKVGLNFDGELLGLGHSLESLIDHGFRWKDEATSELCLNKDKGRAAWLKSIRVVPDDMQIEPFYAWTVEYSRCNFVQCSMSELFFVRDVNSHWITDETL